MRHESASSGDLPEIAATHLADRLGTRIQHFRELRGWTQRELARRAGLSPSRMSRIERNIVPIDLLLHLAEALEVSVDEILGGPLSDPSHLAQEIDQLAVDLAALPGLGRLVPILQGLLKLRARGSSLRASSLPKIGEPDVAPACQPEEDQSP